MTKAFRALNLGLEQGSALMAKKYKLSFKQWREKVDQLFNKRVSCTWADLAGDLGPILQAYNYGDTPEKFVQYIIDKYDLDDTPIDRPPWMNPRRSANMAKRRKKDSLSSVPTYTYVLIGGKKTTWRQLVGKHNVLQAKRIWRKHKKWIDWQKHDASQAKRHHGKNPGKLSFKLKAKALGAARRKAANPSMSLMTMALAGAGAYLFYKYVIKK